MSRSIGGVRVTARPVLVLSAKHAFGDVAVWGQAHPQARPCNGPDPRSLDFAAWYVAGVLCEVNGHQHEFGNWPCEEALRFATTEMHRVADHKFNPSQKESSGENHKKNPAKPGKGPGRRAGGKSGKRKP